MLSRKTICLFTIALLFGCSKENTIPRATSISITGNTQVGETLKASYEFQDDDNDLEALSLYQWYRADDSIGLNEQLIIGATDSIYNLTTDDENFYVGIKITPIAESGANPGIATQSKYIGPIQAAPPSNVINPITGRTWLDKNLGAIQVATSITDADAYGDLFQWGRAADGHEHRNSSTTTGLAYSDSTGHSDFILRDTYPYNWRSAFGLPWQGVNGISNPCPTDYRVPTEAEFIEEYESWSSLDLYGAFSSVLKIPAGGTRYHNDGLFHNVGSGARFWTSTTSGVYSKHVVINTDTIFMYPWGRAQGMSVRCILD